MTSLANNYNRRKIAFKKGKGSFLYSINGNRYLDFVQGIAVNSLGHSNSYLTKKLIKQAKKVWHVSNAFIIPEGEKLAKRLTQKTFADYVIFQNSGAEATEAAIKAGYTKDRKGAKTQGSVLLNHNPVVRNYLIDLEIAASERDAVSLENHLSTLHDLREEAKDQGQISAAITAEVHRGKAGGLYIDRREILTAKIDMMSKDDILTRLEQLINKRASESNVIDGDFSAKD